MGSLTGGKNILLETYFGTPKEFAVVESELKKIIDMIKKDQNSGITTAKSDIDKSDSNKTIERVLTKFFGVKYIKIHWTTSGVNAYTRITSIPIMFSNNSRLKEANKKFINENLQIYIFIDTMLVSLAELNEKELLAVLLHEIGHNFDVSPFYFAQMLPLLLAKPMIWVLIGPIQVLISEIDIFIDNFLKTKLPFLFNIFASLNEVREQISGPLLIGNPTKLINYVMAIPKAIIGSIFGYGMERFSDSFAAAYGYGTHQASALHKMENIHNVYYKFVTSTPVINLVSDFWWVTIRSLMHFLDPHPGNQTRIVNMINKLKRDLNDPSLPKDLKKDLEQNIAVMEKYYEKDFLEDKDVKQKKAFTYMNQKIAEQCFGGKLDFREIMDSMYSKYEA